jgi:YidC/Oxa1 family membrane protein insertase
MWDAFVGFMINILLYIYNLVGQNFGVAIILFTLLIRLVTHPLTAKQMQGSTAMADMQKDKRWIEAQKKYKNDKEKLSQEQMKLYKELGINPFASCLPTVIQLPIIIALYQAVIQSLAATPYDLIQFTNKVYAGFINFNQIYPLNHQFLWMDLGKPDLIIIAGLGFPIPILAVLVVITTYIQSKLTTPPSSGSDDQSAAMANSMTMMMPFMMGYMALTLASGLSLYFLASNVIGIGQYAILGKVNWRNLLPSVKSNQSAKK